MMTAKTLIQEIAGTMNAYQNCVKSGNGEWADKHEDRLIEMNGYLPSGSGIDNGSKLSKAESTDKKIIIYTSFHHMNEVGIYDGWTDHKIIITPSFSGMDIKITGPNRNGIKEYLQQIFYDSLMGVI